MYLVRVIPARGPDAGGAYGTAISLRGTGLSGPLLPVRDSTRTRAPRSSRVAPGQLYGPPTSRPCAPRTRRTQRRPSRTRPPRARAGTADLLLGVHVDLQPRYRQGDHCLSVASLSCAFRNPACANLARCALRSTVGIKPLLVTASSCGSIAG